MLYMDLLKCKIMLLQKGKRGVTDTCSSDTIKDKMIHKMNEKKWRRPAMKYDNIIFDLYGTLVDIWTDEDQSSLWEALSHEFFLHRAEYMADELKKTYLKLCEIEERRLKKKRGKYAEINLETVFMKLFEKKGIQCTNQTVKEMMLRFRALSLKRLKLYDGGEELLSALKMEGKKIYLLTNAQRVFTEQEIVFLGLNHYFDGILYSSDAGVKKPDVHFYEKMIDAYCLDREKTVMIGNDALCDIEGALNAGLSAIYIESNIQSNHKCPENLPIYKVNELNLLKKELIQK